MQTSSLVITSSILEILFFVIGAGVDTNHLAYAVKAFPMKAEGLFKQHLIFNCPLVRERSEVCQVSESLVNVMLVPK